MSKSLNKEGVYCILFDGTRILLHRGKYGGQWDGPIGWLLPGEKKEECAVRVCVDQTGIRIADPYELGLIRFFANDQRVQPDRVLHVLISNKLQGPILDKQERKFLGRKWVLQWFPLHKLPLRGMSDEELRWTPFLIANRRFQVDFYYKGEYEDPGELLDYRVSLE